MLKAFFARLLLAVACLACLAGCGEGDSETRGTIEMGVFSTQLSPGLSLVEVEAAYIDPDRGAVPGFDITITIRIETPDGALIAERSEELRTDSTGVVNYDLEVVQGSVDSIVTVTASSGGLAERDRVVIPAATPVTPTAP